MKTILITGATGVIGTHFINTYKHLYHFIAITRQNHKIININNANLDILTWTEFGKNKLKIIEKTDAIINLAGEPLLKPFTKKHKLKIYKSRIEITQFLVNAIEQSKKKPSCLINASAIGYYDTKHLDKPLIETDQNGNNFIATLCNDWEKEAQKTHIRSIQLRIGLVLAKESGFLKTILRPFNYYVGGYLGSGKQGCPWIHIKDVTQSIKFILDTKSISGPVNLTAPHRCTLKTFCKTLSSIIHKPSWLHIPSIIIKITLGELGLMILNTPIIKPQKLQDYKYKFSYDNLETALKSLLT